MEAISLLFDVYYDYFYISYYGVRMWFAALQNKCKNNQQNASKILVFIN